ncbi:methyl-accepting chemotaxis protein [uncultured Desulfobacter sp.]|uniref:methyl-accepting chemotaxis protein n=1 Tax=uncultured Desulfobacter sp. TaxID=240139 RepID=UPI0029C80E55|nr:methyl-accepting chemotaxis protein [uncultured Desulfobacter sp.]
MNHPTPYKRKLYFVNKELQGKFIFNYFILLTLGSILFIAIFSFFSSNTLSIVYENYHLQLGTTPGILFKKILSAQWLFILLGGIVICFITMRLTHRVAGPFYRFEKTVDEMSKGDLSVKIGLREKDEGKELAEKINLFNSKLLQNLNRIQDLNAGIGMSAEKIKAGLETDRREDILKLVEHIESNRKEIEVAVKEYTDGSQVKG